MGAIRRHAGFDDLLMEHVFNLFLNEFLVLLRVRIRLLPYRLGGYSESFSANLYCRLCRLSEAEARYATEILVIDLRTGRTK